MARIQCPDCKGTGYIRIGLKQEECHTCHSRGHVYDKDCYNCDYNLPKSQTCSHIDFPFSGFNELEDCCQGWKPLDDKAT